MISNKLQQKFKHIAQQTGQPGEEQDRISYGIISEVHEETGQVKLKVFQTKEEGGDLELLGFHPMIHERHVVHLLFGPLRSGLYVRIFWRGKSIRSSTRIRAEVIGGDHYLPRQQEADECMIEVGNYKIFSGGVL